MPPRRVAYLDLDGTATHEGSIFHTPDGVSIGASLALARLYAAGYEIVPVSGRKVADLRETARLLGARHYIAELGSLLAYDRGARVLRLATRRVRDLVDEGVPDFLFKAYPGSLEWHAPWHEGREHTLLLRGRVPVAEARARLATQYPGLTLVDNGEVGEGLHAYHVLEASVGKRAAIGADRRERGIPREGAVAFGDSEGDAEMAREVGRYFWIGRDTRGRAGDGLLEAVEALLDPAARRAG